MPRPSTLVFCTLLLWAANPTIAAIGQPPVEPPSEGKHTSQGCYSSLGNHEGVSSRSRDGSNMANSPLWCNHRCLKERRPVAALHQNQCFCMDTYPPRSALVADSECSVPCPAYIIASCGGKDAYSVYNVGIQLSIEHQEEQDGFAGTGEDANPEGEVSAAPEAAKEEL